MSEKHYIRCDAEGRELPADATDYAIVFDPATGLEWLADLLPEQHDFEGAGKAAAELDIAGGGWRLPTYHEAASIVDVTRFKPARNPVFRGANNDGMWTSTPDASGPQHLAWVVGLSYGGVTLYYQYSQFWVRPVRSARRASSQ